MFIFFSLSDILLQCFPALTIWFPIILLLNIIVKHEPGCEAAAECGARSGSGGAARLAWPIFFKSSLILTSVVGWTPSSEHVHTFSQQQVNENKWTRASECVY